MWRLPVLLLPVLAALLFLSAGASHRVQGQTALLGSDEQALLDLINDYRAQYDLPTLGVSPTLTAAAQWMSQDMAEYGYIRHVDSLGRDPAERMADFGYDYLGSRGEVVKAGSDTPEATFEAWRNSPGHNQVMLTGSFRVAGVGKAYNPNSRYGTFWTVDFGGYDDSGDPSPTATATATPTPTPTPTPTATPTPTPEPTVTEQLASIDGKYSVVYGFDPATQAFRRHVPGRPEMSDLSKLEVGSGYLVLASEDATLSYAGHTWQIKQGWSFVGWY